MRPDWRILIDDQDRTGAFRDRLLSLTITDESGYHADTVSVRLDDRDGRIVLPRPGVEMAVQLGYEETERAQMGRYRVDEVEVSGPPDTLLVRGKSVDMFASLKQHKSRSWSGTLGNIVRVIAAEHDLEARVSSRLASVQILHMDQTEESDLHFLTRLGQQYDAVAKPAGRYLLLVARGEAMTATGRSMTSKTLHRSQTSRHRFTMPNRSRYRSVIAYFHEPKSGTKSRVRVGSGTPSYTLRNPYPTANEARAAAAARLRELA